MIKQPSKVPHAPKKLTIDDLKNIKGGNTEPTIRAEDAAGNKAEIGLA